MVNVDKKRFGPWAIVTGASSGIGKEFARQLAASGLNLLLAARRLSLLEDWGKQLAKQFHVQYRAVGVDLSEEGFLDKITTATHDLDVGLLVSNAGVGVPTEFLQADRQALHSVVRLNVVAHLELSRYFGAKLVRRGHGGIILVSAFGAAQGIPYMANDSATKAYVLSLGEALHVELQKSGVNVSVLLPGPTDTPVIAEFGLDVKTMPIKPMSVERCVSEGLTALNANQASHVTGRMFRLVNTFAPRMIVARLNGAMMRKAAMARRARTEQADWSNSRP